MPEGELLQSCDTEALIPHPSEFDSESQVQVDRVTVQQYSIRFRSRGRYRDSPALSLVLFYQNESEGSMYPTAKAMGFIASRAPHLYKRQVFGSES